MNYASLFRLDKLRSLQLMQLLRFAATLAGSILVARHIADRRVVGEFEFWVLLGSSTTFFWVSGIINTFIPFYHRQNVQHRRTLVFNVFALLSGAAAAVALFIWIGTELPHHPLPTQAWYYIGYALLAAPAFLIEYLFLINDRPGSLTAYAVISCAGYALAFLIPFHLGYGLAGVVKALFLLGVLRYGYLVFLSRIFGRWTFSFEALKPFLRQSWPVMASLLFGGSMIYVDAYIVRAFFPADQFALFQYGARELPLTALLANAISNVASGELAGAQGDAASLISLKARSRRLMHLLFPISFVLIIFSNFLYGIVFTKAYIASAGILDIYLLLIISRVLFPQTVLLGLGQTKTLLRATIWEWCLNLALNFIFLYLFGLPGIAFATVAAYLFEKLYLAGRLKKLGIDMRAYTPLKTWALYILAILAVYCAKLCFFHPA